MNEEREVASIVDRVLREKVYACTRAVVYASASKSFGNTTQPSG